MKSQHSLWTNIWIFKEAKYDAASILGCLIGFPDYFGDMKLLNQISTSPSPHQSQSSPSGAPFQGSSASSSFSQSIDENLTIEQFSKEELKNQIIHSLTSFNDEPSNTNSRYPLAITKTIQSISIDRINFEHIFSTASWRCVVLCALTCFIFDEITNQRFHPRLNDAIKRIFKDLDSRDVR